MPADDFSRNDHIATEVVAFVFDGGLVDRIAGVAERQGHIDREFACATLGGPLRKASWTYGILVVCRDG